MHECSLMRLESWIFGVESNYSTNLPASMIEANLKQRSPNTVEDEPGLGSRQVGSVEEPLGFSFHYANNL